MLEVAYKDDLILRCCEQLLSLLLASLFNQIADSSIPMDQKTTQKNTGTFLSPSLSRRQNGTKSRRVKGEDYSYKSVSLSPAPLHRDDRANSISLRGTGTRDEFSSSVSDPRDKYDVFLSFRGEDTRDGFAYNLYRGLLGKGLRTFRDDDEIGLGKHVRTELMEAIKDSKYSILLISPTYASSSWCLDELVRIFDCSETPKQTVYAVFYHVDPSDVRNPKGDFKEQFSKAVSKSPESEERWKEALGKIADVKGLCYPSPGYRHEYHFIDKLAEVISDNLKDAHPYHAEGLVGMRPRMNTILKLLNLGSDEARMVGICGMGGVGKTALARAVYDLIRGEYDGFSFFENVTKTVKSSGITAIHEHLISDTLKKKHVKLDNVSSGLETIRDQVCRKRVLIVLDGVDGSVDLENLIGELDWYSQGSRIIITTRDMLAQLHREDVYVVPRLERYDAEKLFKYVTFRKKEVPGEFQELMDRALKYGDGNPLAVKFLGRSLINLTFDEWKDTLDRLKEKPDDTVQDILRVSYDGLRNNEKDIFLDICCFYKGKCKDEVINLLESCGFNPRSGVEVLVRKNLLTILENNTVWMHGLHQKMAWTIVEEKKQLGERSRLWRHNDIKRVLTENRERSEIEGICDNDPALGAENFKLRKKSFANMTNLRVLKICYTCASIDLPNTLNYLHWQGYPLKRMPSKFVPVTLVELCLTHSRIKQLWQGEQKLPKLTVLDLSHSTRLANSPNFECFPNLERLFLEGCTRLQKLHRTIKELKSLTILILKGCTSLKTIPNGIQSQCLKILKFSGCLKLSKIVECFLDLKQLSELYLDGTGIEEVPESISNSTDLCHLDLSCCKKLKRIASSIGKLKKLKKLLLMSCYSLKELPEEVGHIKSLEILDVANSGVRQLPWSDESSKNLQVLFLRNWIRSLPPSSFLSFLCFLPTSTTISRSNCMTLVLPSFSRFNSLTSLDLRFCFLKSIPESISYCSSLKELILTENEFECLPASIKDLRNLEKLWLLNCRKLRELPELPSTVRYLVTSGCESLTTICSPYLFRDAMLLSFTNCAKLIDNKEIHSFMENRFLLNQIKVNNHVESRVYSGPGSEIPKWFTHQNNRASVKFKLPPFDLNLTNLLGFALSAVVSTENKDCKICVQMSVNGNFQKGCWDFLCYQNSEDVFILYVPIQGFMVDTFRQDEIEVKFCYSTTDYNDIERASRVDEARELSPEVKSCGVHLIYEADLGIIEVKYEKPVVTIETDFHFDYSSAYELRRLYDMEYVTDNGQ